MQTRSQNSSHNRDHQMINALYRLLRTRRWFRTESRNQHSESVRAGRRALHASRDHQLLKAGVTLATVLLLAQIAEASRLESAVTSAQSTIISIAQISSGIGIAVGGFLMSIGWSSAGKTVLSGAVCGAFASFGGPAVIEFVRTLF